MRIESLTLCGIGGSPDLQWHDVTAGLNALYDPLQSTNSSVTGFLAHVLFGQPAGGLPHSARRGLPAGDVVVRRGSQHYRLRRYKEGASAPRLTVAALDGSPVDGNTIRELVGRLSPAVLAPLCSVSFHEPPNLGRLLSPELDREFQAINGARPMFGSRRTSELAARRDLLAQELETRIAGERRISKELDTRWRELDRLVREEQHQATSREQRLRATEAALAETDIRLRYRRLELNVELRWHAQEPEDCEPQLVELDHQIARWRATLAELAQQEASVRTRLAENQSHQSAGASAVVNQRAWLSVARHLAADLAGEVSRLARAAASEQCVCRDAHPRLRPIAETMERQLDLLQSLVDDEHSALRAEELQREVEGLSRTQYELRGYLDNLLERRQMLARGVRPSLRAATSALSAAVEASREGDHGASDPFSAADAEQLEERRLELEQERFHLTEQLSEHQRTLRDLRAQRDTVERQRAALLSARSIEHVQRELADVQRKLEQAAGSASQHEAAVFSVANISRAADFLAQLTNGELVRIILGDGGGTPRVVTRGGAPLAVDAISAAQHDLVYLSLCLGLLTAAAQQGIWLPLVLDEPFARLDASCTAALAAVLDDFARRGQQVLVLTSQRLAAERLTSMGAAVRDVGDLHNSELITEFESEAKSAVMSPIEKKRAQRQPSPNRKRKKSAKQVRLNGKTPLSGQNDAA